MSPTTLAQRSFTTAEMVDIVGCSYRQAHYWDATHLLKPSVKPATGSGSRRTYSAADVELGRMIMALARFGSLATARVAAAELRNVVEATVRPAGVYVTNCGFVTNEAPAAEAALWLPIGGVS